MRRSDETLVFEVEPIRQTNKAYLVRVVRLLRPEFDDVEVDAEVWFPKSQVQTGRDENGQYLGIPKWLAEKKAELKDAVDAHDEEVSAFASHEDGPDMAWWEMQ